MQTKLLILILLTGLLQACIPAAFVAGVAGGAIVYDNRNLKTIAQDRETSYAAWKKIANDPSLIDQVHISVATFNRIVLLTGQAPTADLSQRVFDNVNGLPNIKRIYNEITIEAPTSHLIRSQDTWITTKTKAAMLAEKGLHSTQIKVVTENRVVYLMGLVTHTQGNLAANVASNIKGVEKVVKLFEYLN